MNVKDTMIQEVNHPARFPEGRQVATGASHTTKKGDFPNSFREAY
jgi:hypothetical protein